MSYISQTLFTTCELRFFTHLGPAVLWMWCIPKPPINFTGPKIWVDNSATDRPERAPRLEPYRPHDPRYTLVYHPQFFDLQPPCPVRQSSSNHYRLFRIILRTTCLAVAASRHPNPIHPYAWNRRYFSAVLVAVAWPFHRELVTYPQLRVVQNVNRLSLGIR